MNNWVKNKKKKNPIPGVNFFKRWKMLASTALCPGTKMDVVQTRQFPELKMFIKRKTRKGFNYRKIGGKFGVSASTACEKTKLIQRALMKACSD